MASPPSVSIPSSATGRHGRFAEVYSVLEEAVGGRAFPGAAFGVLSGGRVLALDGIGHFTYDRSSAPVTASTVYDLASLTKVLAATSMAMLLGERGRLDLDQPLVELLPGFAAPDEAPRRAVTLRLLLAHASGLPGYAPLFQTCRDSGALVQACLRLPIEAVPGTRAEYSDPGFILLGRALEAIAREPLDLFCAREVFQPLGMSSACFRPPASWRDCIPPTEEDALFRRRVIQGEVQDENCFVLGGVSGHAGLFSNALDLLRYAQSLLGGGRQLFAPETVRQFTTRSGLPPGTSRALGWDTPSPPSSSGEFFSPHSAGHLGFAGTSLWIDFERRLAVALLTNRTWPHRESQAIRQVRPAFHDAVVHAIG